MHRFVWVTQAYGRCRSRTSTRRAIRPNQVAAVISTHKLVLDVRWYDRDNFCARSPNKDIVKFRRVGFQVARSQVGMKRPVGSVLGGTRGTGDPKPLSARALGLGRLIACIVVALVLSLFILPAEAQAHGLHGTLGETAQTVGDDATKQAVLRVGPEISPSSCVTCCASSGCVAVSVPEAFMLSDTGPRKNSLAVGPSLLAYPTAQYGVRRPPRQSI